MQASLFLLVAEFCGTHEVHDERHGHHGSHSTLIKAGGNLDNVEPTTKRMLAELPDHFLNLIWCQTAWAGGASAWGGTQVYGINIKTNEEGVYAIRGDFKGLGDDIVHVAAVYFPCGDDGYAHISDIVHIVF